MKASFISDPLTATAIRALEWVHGSIIGAVFSLVPALIARSLGGGRRLLDKPKRHRHILQRIAVLGVGLAAVGGLPRGALVRTSWEAPSEAVAMLASVAQTVTSYAGGIGYSAIAGLVAIRIGVRDGVWARDRPGPVISALAACGQRSMTCYLLQSVVFVAVLAAYGGGLGNQLRLTEIAVLALVTWTLTVLLADGMSRRGYRGPAEVLLRRLTYGSSNTVARS